MATTEAPWGGWEWGAWVAPPCGEWGAWVRPPCAPPWSRLRDQSRWMESPTASGITGCLFLAVVSARCDRRKLAGMLFQWGFLPDDPDWGALRQYPGWQVASILGGYPGVQVCATVTSLCPCCHARPPAWSCHASAHVPPGRQAMPMWCGVRCTAARYAVWCAAVMCCYVVCCCVMAAAWCAPVSPGVQLLHGAPVCPF